MISGTNISNTNTPKHIVTVCQPYSWSTTSNRPLPTKTPPKLPVDGMNTALTAGDYQWALGTDGLPVLKRNNNNP